MFERRLQVLLIALAVVCFGLVVRAFSLQVVEQRFWAKKSEDALTDARALPTVRGRILDVKGRELAVDQPCTDACVHYQAIVTVPDRKWLTDTARTRVKAKVDNYLDLPLAEKKTLLAAETERVKADIDTMWHELAAISHQSDDQIDELRRQIVRRVETRRRLVWVHKYIDASKAAQTPPWYVRIFGSGPAELDRFDVHVAEESDAQVVLPHIDYATRNELARRTDRYPGLALRDGVERVYPMGSLACQTVGRIAKVNEEDLKNDPRRRDDLGKYTASDDIGREGLEQMLEPQLRGTRGRAIADEDDDPAAPKSPTDVAPVAGQDVTTTLDADLQTAVEKAFEHVTFVRSAHLPPDDLDMPGAAVVIDLPTGEVRAMASWPTYDLNKFDDLFPTLVKDQLRRPLSNRATGLAVDPGSTVKPIVGIGAITAGVFGARDTIHCGGYVVVNGRTYKAFGKCWTMQMFGNTHATQPNNPHPTGDLTFPEALQRSCNVFHEELAYRLGIDGLSFWFDKFGLGKPVGVGLPESDGMLPREWNGPFAERVAKTCMAGIGEGIVHATPLQMANVAATIARGGIAIRPTLIRGTPPVSVDLRLDPVAVAEARQGMHDVVNTAAGTGTAAQMPELILSAKTGSAQVGPLRVPERDEQNNRVRDVHGRVVYDEITPGTHDAPNPLAPWYRYTGQKEDTRPAHGWMIGYAPADRPTVAFAVLVEYGGGGGPAAGSVVKKLLAACERLGYVKGGS